MRPLFRVLMTGIFIITGLALSAAEARDQQFSPPLRPDITPQWTPIPGAPGVQHAPILILTCSAMGRGIITSMMASGIRPGTSWVRGKGSRTSPGVFTRSRPLIQATPRMGRPHAPIAPRASRLNGFPSRENQECITPPIPIPTCSAMGRGITTSIMASGIRPTTSRVRGKGSRTSPGVFTRSRPLF